MEVKYVQRIAGKLNLSLKQINSVHGLHAEGATIPFMARYRKEATGNLDEVAIGNVIEQIKYFDELDKRKETVLKTIDGLGKLTPELKSRIENSFDAVELEDLYLPYKPKRKTRATQAIEKGLEPLAQIIFQQNGVDLTAEARKYIGEQVKDVNEALQKMNRREIRQDSCLTKRQPFLQKWLIAKKKILRRRNTVTILILMSLYPGVHHTEFWQLEEVRKRDFFRWTSP